MNPSTLIPTKTEAFIAIPPENDPRVRPSYVRVRYFGVRRKSGMLVPAPRRNLMRALIDRYIDAYNRIDVDAMLATMHSEVIFENYTAGVLSVRTISAQELRHLAESSRYLFSAR